MLQVQSITVADLPAINDLWYEAFRPTGIISMMPDTPGIRQWWIDANSHDILNKAASRYWKVVDDETGALVAYAKWSMEAAEERGDRFPPWHPDMNQQVCSDFFGQLENQRRQLVGGKQNYYLDMLCTHPNHRGRGAGSMLVAKGCEEADRDQVPSYVDATAEGFPIYARQGFEDRTIPDTAATGVSSMVRQPKSS